MAPNGLQIAQRADSGELQFRRVGVLRWPADGIWLAHSDTAYRATQDNPVRDLKCIACRQPIAGQAFTTVAAIVADCCPSDKLHTASLVMLIHADCVIPTGDQITTLVIHVAQTCED